MFIEIARELRRARPAAEIHFICGADAAERIVTWDYGDPRAIERHLEEFGLLVAARQGVYTPPEHLRHRVRQNPPEETSQETSSLAMRRTISAAERWNH